MGLILLSIAGFAQNNPVVIDETNKTESIVQTIKIDSVWAGHPVGFCLLTHGNRQYIAYYNAERRTVLGQRKLNDDKFELHVLPATDRETASGTSTVVGWDSHNFLTLGIDKDGFIHLSGNVHVNPLTYFRSTKPNDISEMKQIFEMVGTEEKRTTYPHFMLTKEGELLYHYRDGGSGNGNEIYNYLQHRNQNLEASARHSAYRRAGFDECLPDTANINERWLVSYVLGLARHSRLFYKS